MLKSDEPSDVALQHLQNVLTSWNFKRIEVRGDGSCLFTAVALAVIQRIQAGDTVLSDTLLSLGLPIHQQQDVHHIALLLRRSMVSEWLENTDVYQGFVTTDIRAAALHFLSTQQFSGDLGDLMIMALSNILHTPFCIFTSVLNMPVIAITPNELPANSVQPLFLTFTQDGPGHYDYALPTGQEQTQSKKTNKCTCGRKSGFTGKACSTGRCACMRSGTQCTSICRCKIATMNLVLDQNRPQQEGGSLMIPKDNHYLALPPTVL